MRFGFLRSKKKDDDESPTSAQRGAQGEDIAVRTLKKCHYTIVERNFRTPAGEIDIIARDGDFLVFVEVRTRSSIEFGLPQETILAHKRDRLTRAARWYLQKNRIEDVPCRFDVVAIVRRDGTKEPQVEVIRNAFRPEKKW